MKRLSLLWLASLLSISVLLASSPVYAASANLYLSPASSSVAQGSTITISVRENSGGEPVNGVQANLSYPTDKFDFVSISNSSAFSVVAENSGGGGSIKIARGALPAVSGDQLVASVRLKAKLNSGSASVAFAGGSSVASANNNANILSGSSGGTYTFKAAPPPAVKDTTPPALTDVKASEATLNSAVITWTSSEPASSQVDYGLNTSYGLSAVDSNMVTAHKVTVNSALMTPGTTYHFVVKSTDPSGNTTTSPDSTFNTKGVTLIVTVVNQKNKPVQGAKVTIEGRTGTTDKKGQTTLSDLPTGDKVAKVEYKKKITTTSVEIKPIDANSTPQNATLKINTSSSSAIIWILPLIALLAILWFLIKRRPDLWNNVRNRFGGGGSSGDVPKTDEPMITPNQQSPTIIKPTEPPDASHS